MLRGPLEFMCTSSRVACICHAWLVYVLCTLINIMLTFAYLGLALVCTEYFVRRCEATANTVTVRYHFSMGHCFERVLVVSQRMWNLSDNYEQRWLGSVAKLGQGQAGTASLFMLNWGRHRKHLLRVNGRVEKSFVDALHKQIAS